jgi:Fe-S-cluster containining protein
MGPTMEMLNANSRSLANWALAKAQMFQYDRFSMDIKDRCDRLKSIYAIYDEFTAGMHVACRRHCATCCTCNVTGTTLEAWLILDHLRTGTADCAGIDEALSRSAPPRRFHPRVTINGMAALCMQGRDLPEELNDPAAGACRLLDGNICPIYDVRPFGCRAMLSTVACSLSAEACMPSLVLTINNIVMQVIEALDQPGASGNLIDLLLFLSDPVQCRAYENRLAYPWPQPLLPNQSMPVLMVPPEHRAAVQPLLRSLSKCST